MELESTTQGYFDCAGEGYRATSESSKNGVSDAQPPAASCGFDCSICLNVSVDPVVTLCGHLYCWPCIYMWLQAKTGSTQQYCPICKAPLSQDTLIPIYGKVLSTKEESMRSVKIPSRPSAHKGHAFLASMIERQSPRHSEDEYFEMLAPMQQSQLRHYHHQQQNRYRYNGGGGGSRDNSFVSDHSLSFAAPVFHSTAGGLLAGMAAAILPWLSRNHEAEQSFASPYCLRMSESSPRLRRQEMQVESSLHQLWLFLLCCALLCLVFF